MDRSQAVVDAVGGGLQQDGFWFTDKRRVAWSETDPSSAYTFVSALKYAEDAEVAYFRAHAVLDDLYPSLPRLYAQARFIQPVRFDDEVVTRIALTRVGSSSIHYIFRLERDAQLCAVGSMGVVHVGSNGRPKPLHDHVAAELRRRVVTHKTPDVEEVNSHLASLSARS